MILMEKKSHILMHEPYVLAQVTQIIKNHTYFREGCYEKLIRSKTELLEIRNLRAKI